MLVSVCGPNTPLLVSFLNSRVDHAVQDLFIAAIPGSFIFTMIFLPLYAIVAPAIGFSTEYFGIVPRLWSNAVFYFMLILVPVLCLARDFVWK
jgi:hypothetical protein